MALTTKILKQNEVVGGFLLSEVEATFPASYTQSEALSASACGLQEISHVLSPQMVNGTEASEKWVGSPYYKGGQLHLNDHKTGKELAAATNTEKVKVVFLALGKGRAK